MENEATLQDAKEVGASWIEAIKQEQIILETRIAWWQYSEPIPNPVTWSNCFQDLSALKLLRLVI